MLDEPEAALSPQRQLALLVLIHDVVKKYKDAQFIISTHSPVLLGYPEAQIVAFGDGQLHDIKYEQTASMQITRPFVNQRDSFLEELFKETPSLFAKDDLSSPPTAKDPGARFADRSNRNPATR